MAQASILGLYDPDRSQAITHLGRISNWMQLSRTLADGSAYRYGYDAYLGLVASIAAPAEESTPPPKEKPAA